MPNNIVRGYTHDPLESEKNNQEAINSISELYNVDEEVATELWHRFIETVKKMRGLSEDYQQATEKSRG
ncbi:MAG TPA: hypothetical protein VJ842_06545 [Pyrinomonadaceae bacterium]|nr:hypothetical protein [Pyrinomonadaceae bacterium]